ncbi:unnamed protein product [Polarella glacialis]|uniref:Uncharacterized protein n=1 Tax=Polarella glacialis TaxID=89957 RepID=A0A813I776_POLGL|nr:unnamed protein product [Polarella glacialis]
MSVAKKARKEGPKEPKAFEEYTITELREVVERKDLLETQLAEKEEELTKQVSTNDSSTTERIKASIAKQLLAQMLFEGQLSAKECELLRGKGRELVALVPNVSSDALKNLGLVADESGSFKNKSASHFLASHPMKTLPGGALLKLQWWVGFKYVKSSCELKVTAKYNWLPKPKPKAAGRPASKDAAGKEQAGESGMENEAAESGMETEGPADDEMQASGADGGAWLVQAQTSFWLEQPGLGKKKFKHV